LGGRSLEWRGIARLPQRELVVLVELPVLRGLVLRMALVMVGMRRRVVLTDAVAMAPRE
jgi:hypothetical protein